MLEQWKNGKTKKRNDERTTPFYSYGLPCSQSCVSLSHHSKIPGSGFPNIPVFHHSIIPVFSFGSQVRGDVDFSLHDFFNGGE
jgi:hypothetical protein